MLQWFLRFSEFPEFNESSAPFRENSNDSFCCVAPHIRSAGIILCEFLFDVMIHVVDMKVKQEI